jgi:hypothetical protein
LSFEIRVISHRCITVRNFFGAEECELIVESRLLLMIVL